jgi:ferredoxin-NADP reductase
MAVTKTARVMGTERMGPDTLLLDLWTAEPLGFVGGQYVIVDSQVVLPNGKAVKRAYSVLSSDTEQSRFQLAVKRISHGPGSGFIHGLGVGMTIRFSGPWGKLAPRDLSTGRTVFLTTDTGITAAMGVLRSARFASALPQTVLIWCRASAEYFLPEEFVRAQIPPQCGEVRFAEIPPVNHSERIAPVRAILRDRLASHERAQIVLVGDGTVNRALFDDLTAAGVDERHIAVESFFNMPKKSTGGLVSEGLTACER